MSAIRAKRISEGSHLRIHIHVRLLVPLVVALSQLSVHTSDAQLAKSLPTAAETANVHTGQITSRPANAYFEETHVNRIS